MDNTVPPSQQPVSDFELKLTMFFAAGGLSGIGAFIAVMGFLMYFLPGW